MRGPYGIHDLTRHNAKARGEVAAVEPHDVGVRPPATRRGLLNEQPVRSSRDVVPLQAGPLVGGRDGAGGRACMLEPNDERPARNRQQKRRRNPDHPLQLRGRREPPLADHSRHECDRRERAFSQIRRRAVGDAVDKPVERAGDLWLRSRRNQLQPARQIDVFFVVHRDTFPWRSSSCRSDRIAWCSPDFTVPSGRSSLSEISSSDRSRQNRRATTICWSGGRDRTSLPTSSLDNASRKASRARMSGITVSFRSKSGAPRRLRNRSWQTFVTIRPNQAPNFSLSRSLIQDSQALAIASCAASSASVASRNRYPASR